MMATAALLPAQHAIQIEEWSYRFVDRSSGPCRPGRYQRRPPDQSHPARRGLQARAFHGSPLLSRPGGTTQRTPHSAARILP